MEILLRKETPAAADSSPITWSFADALPDQVYADYGIYTAATATPHRVKNNPELFGVWTALAIRIVDSGSDEFKNAGCQAALHKELTTLQERHVWDENSVCEWSDTARQGKACVGRVCAIMGEKHSEISKPLASKTYKARCVFAGNNVQTSSGQPAWGLYQEVSQTPAAMQIVRAALGIAGLRGYIPKVRDATQAYVLAVAHRHPGPPCNLGANTQSMVATILAYPLPRPRLQAAASPIRAS